MMKELDTLYVPNCIFSKKADKNNKHFFFIRHCQNLRIFSYVNGSLSLVKTKCQANFKDFKRFGAFKGLVEQKNVVRIQLVGL
jgi:hypothetical protein